MFNGPVANLNSMLYLQKTIEKMHQAVN